LSTSTTTERLAQLGAFAGNAALLLAAWFALVLVVTPLLPPGLPLAAVFPSTTAPSGLPQYVRILDWQPNRIQLVSDRPGLALELYRRGAWLVMPLGSASCLGITRAMPEAEGAANMRRTSQGG
jgi:hypothetical protein